MEATFIKRRELTYALWMQIITEAFGDYMFYLVSVDLDRVQVAKVADKIHPFSNESLNDQIKTTTLMLDKEMVFAERFTDTGKSLEKLDYVRYTISHENKLIYIQRKGVMR